MDKIAHLINCYDALVLRQRIILLLSILSIIYLAFYLSFFLPVSAKKQDLELENTYLLSLHEEVNQLKENQAREGKALDIVNLNNKLFKLKDEVAILNLELKEYFSIASSADNLMSIVRDLVKTTKGLTLEKMELLPTENMKIGLSEPSLDNDISAELGDEAILKNEKELVVYKHKIYIEVKGDYASLVDYLRKIESLEWGLFIQEAYYKVEDYPVSVATIMLYSLSLGGDEYEI